MNKTWIAAFFLISVCLIALAYSGCQSYSGQAGGTEPPTNNSTEVLSQELVSTNLPFLSEISLGKITPAYFSYNMASDSLTLIQHSGNTYTAHYLQSNGNIKKEKVKWRIPSGYFLDSFVYGSDGTFYAVLKHYDKKGQTKQSFIKLKNNGTYQIIKLKDLDKIPKTKMDSYIKKKGKSSDRSITDIHFYGTALSIIYSNYAVKFYNIAERLSLGDTHITGTAGQNAFYDNIFVSTGLTSGYESVLNFFDIRTGEKLHSLSMDKLSMGELLFLANYRNTLYVLTKNGLYEGSVTNPEFTLAADMNSLGLPGGGRIHKLFAARDEKLYLVYQDSQAVYHLYRTN
jgi:hypothetical protein